MKHWYAGLLLLLPFAVKAQPAGYYNTAYGSSGEALRIALYNIIKGHTVLSYGGSQPNNTWTAFQSTDKTAAGKVWDIYSDKPGGTPSYTYDFTQKCGNGAGHENSCYNHEHTWPQSLFNSNFPMESDLWIVYPTDYYVNGQRSNLPYGTVGGTPTKLFTNGTKIGTNNYPGSPSGQCFEPIDSFKGDIARTYFYITTRYYADSGQFSNWEMAVRNRLQPWVIQMLLTWHHNDPVSKKEKDRNEAAYAIQHNRNPFIDEPRFADCIWAGNCAGLDVPSIAAITSHIHTYPNPAINEVRIDWSELAPSEVLAVDLVNLQGQIIYHFGNARSNSVSIPVRDFARGFYMLRMQTKAGPATQRLILQ